LDVMRMHNVFARDNATFKRRRSRRKVTEPCCDKGNENKQITKDASDPAHKRVKLGYHL
jgi:hypothetical protein